MDKGNVVVGWEGFLLSGNNLKFQHNLLVIKYVGTNLVYLRYQLVADEGLCCSSALVSDVEESVL